MNVRKTTIVLAIAGLLLVGATGVVFATSGAPASDTAAVLAAASPSPSAPAAPGWNKSIEDTALADALDGLVAKGTITATQKTAILDAVVAEKEARRAERDAYRQQLRSFLADGKITQDELDKLPADSPLRQMTNLMDDGQITLDELRSLGRGFMGGGKGGHGGGMGGFGRGWDDGAAPAPSASPTTSG